MSPIELYRSETILVRCVPAARGDRWIVTFDNHSIGDGFDRPGFGEHFLRQEGYSALHVMGRGNDWYQYRDLPRALAVARAHIAGRRAITYGSSMGGYAALRFAHLLGAEAAIALSPQYSNDRRVVPWERRWIDDAARIRWQPELNGRMRFCGHAIMIYDPIGEDRRHAAMIAADIPATSIPLPHGGHPVTTFLAEMDLLRPLLADVCDNRFDALHFRTQVRQHRSRSSIYLGQLALAQPRLRPAQAERLARAGLSTAPNSVLARYFLGTVLLQTGRHEEALAQFAIAVDATERRDAIHLYNHANALLAADRPLQAIRVMQEAAALKPRSAHIWAWLAEVFWRTDQKQEAMRMRICAIRLAPRRAAHWIMLGRYIRRSLWKTLISVGQDRGAPWLEKMQRGRDFIR